MTKKREHQNSSGDNDTLITASDSAGSGCDGNRIDRRTVLRYGAAAATVAAAHMVPGAGAGQALAQEAGNVPKMTLKFGHPYNVKHPLHKGVEMFARLVDERTGGRVKVTIYPNSTIGASQALVTNMQLGTVDMALVPTTDVATFYHPIDVFYLPFIFSGRKHAYRVSDGPVGQGLYEGLRDKVGIRTLAMFESGFRTITTRETPVHLPEDLNGLKMRVPNNPINIETFRALGANATPMAISEVFTALQQGTVDGQDNPIGNVYAYGFYKVQDYETLSNHQWAGIMFLGSESMWKRVPKKLQEILANAAKESESWERAELNRKSEEYLRLMQNEGLEVIRLTNDQRQTFQEAAREVWSGYEDELGEKLIQRVLNA